MANKPPTKKTKITYVLKQFMDARGLTRLGTAKKCGLSYQTVFGIYHNRAIQIRNETLEKLYDGIGADVSDVIGRS